LCVNGEALQCPGLWAGFGWQLTACKVVAGRIYRTNNSKDVAGCGVDKGMGRLWSQNVKVSTFPSGQVEHALPAGVGVDDPTCRDTLLLPIRW